MTALRFALVAAAMGLAAAHDMGLPVNPRLGVPGFPDCRNPRLAAGEVMTVEEAAMAIECAQKEAPNDAIRIGTVGDSITAGVHSTGEGTIAPPRELLNVTLALQSLDVPCNSTVAR